MEACRSQIPKTDQYNDKKEITVENLDDELNLSKKKLIKAMTGSDIKSAKLLPFIPSLFGVYDYDC
uniref:Uncharacterized protein n=1 Tax=Wuchereria bancrofti TaxID=6293 RepID=A0AAF5Q6U7_WUCBA